MGSRLRRAAAGAPAGLKREPMRAQISAGHACDRLHSALCCPLTSAVRDASGAAKARPGRLRRFASAVGAARRLPCDARSHGPVAELTTLPAVAAFGQRRRVRRRCALRARPRALALQAAPGQEARPFARHKQSPGLLVSLLTFSAPQRRAYACPGVPLLNQRWHAAQGEPLVDFAAGAARGGRFLWRREAQRQGRRA